MSRTIRAVVAPILVAVTASAAQGQSAKSVLDHMKAEYTRRMANVHDYTVVQETMGMTNVAYMVKEMVDGMPVFRTKSMTVNGVTTPASEDERTGLEDVYGMTDRLAASAEYVGTETVDGHKTHVLRINDLSGLDLASGTQDKDADFTPKKGKMFVDAQRWVPLRFEFEGALKNGKNTADVTSVVSLGDYREVSGMLHPFHMTMQVSGMMAAMDPETRAKLNDPETRKQLEDLKKQMAEMPEAQRKMMEKMMKGQLEMLEKMTAGGGDTMTVETQVQEIRVNAGPPSK